MNMFKQDSSRHIRFESFSPLFWIIRIVILGLSLIFLSRCGMGISRSRVDVSSPSLPATSILKSGIYWNHQVLHLEYFEEFQSVSTPHFPNNNFTGVKFIADGRIDSQPVSVRVFESYFSAPGISAQRELVARSETRDNEILFGLDHDSFDRFSRVRIEIGPIKNSSDLILQPATQIEFSIALGDFDFNYVVNMFDIDPFTDYCGSFGLLADIDGDGLLCFGDHIDDGGIISDVFVSGWNPDLTTLDWPD